MNPFETIFNKDFDEIKNLSKEYKITVWVEPNGRKNNTYISGWKIPDSEMKEHLKTFKKKNGCNGTIKEVINESKDELVKVMQFQGDHIDNIIKYLNKNGVDSDSIYLKGR